MIRSWLSARSGEHSKSCSTRHERRSSGSNRPKRSRQLNGAPLIDIRSDLDRERDGIVSGSLHIPRTVLEWRLDLDSSWRNPHVSGLGAQIVLLCDHGCSSVFAAATLVDLGFERAGDVVGGFAAWREAGLPTAPSPRYRRRSGEPAGMRPPYQ